MKEVIKIKGYVIEWTNKHSEERGFVARVLKKQGHFINASSPEEIKCYPNKGLACADIKKLIEIGEAENNEFEAIPYQCVRLCGAKLC